MVHNKQQKDLQCRCKYWKSKISNELGFSEGKLKLASASNRH